MANGGTDARDQFGAQRSALDDYARRQAEVNRMAGFNGKAFENALRQQAMSTNPAASMAATQNAIKNNIGQEIAKQRAGIAARDDLVKALTPQQTPAPPPVPGQLMPVQPQGPVDSFRQRQVGLSNLLGDLASGNQSLSQMQLRQATDRNIAQQQALAALNPGNVAAARGASQNAARLGAGLAGQAAQAGIAERTAAQQGLAGLLGSARGQDIGMDQFNANLAMQQSLANQQALQNLLGLDLQNSLQQRAGTSDFERARLGQENLNAQALNATKSGFDQLMGGVASSIPLFSQAFSPNSGG